ncbi:hypothetical protein PHMEG_00030750 [Phytophthora megakarya]|uniref:M96 mating-specific protein n=1 Tax=Phytophthora megakarya TaxID=4795 RepID=A0A225V267_9STRA|nr:hypothetical protein PHMEG_00030750 [Phytophthora megakarya]
MDSTKPAKKRVRREKQELQHLRALAVKLGSRMEELQAADTNKSEFSTSIWKPIAERQRKERTRAEKQNRELLDSVEEQLRDVTRMKKMLHRRLLQYERITLTGNQTDDDIFADQLAHVQQAHIEAAVIFAGSEFRTSLFNGVHVVADVSSDTGVAFIARSHAVMPFDIQVTEKGFWRAFEQQGDSKARYFYDQRLLTDTVVANSYGLLFRAGRFHGNVWGKQTYRRHAADGCILIMWKSMVEPVEINGTKFSGLRCHQTGWIKLSGIKLADTVSGSVMSTALQSYSKMIVELRDHIVDRDIQITALTDFVVNSHETITDVYGGMINDTLVEEDWNLNGWSTS